MQKQISLGFIIWLSGLSMVSFLATDMYLPAFASMEQALNSSSTEIGWTLSVFLLGMAIGQLLYGPLSDRFGRIRMLTIGLGLFVLGSLGCAFAPSIELLLLCRFLQALGACSASVIWQAVVIDRYQSPLSERLFATVMPLVALSPALAPLLGAVVNSHYGWRAIFLVLVLIGIGLALVSMRQIDYHQRNSLGLNPFHQFKQDYREVFSSRQFIGNTLIFAAAAACFFAWLTGSPFVMHQLGYSAEAIGLSYLPQTVAFIVGGYSCRALLNRFSGQVLLPWIIVLQVFSVALMLIIAWVFKPTTIWPLLLPFCLVALANSGIYPIVINQALSGFKHCAATASGLLNFLQTLLAFVVSALVAVFASSGMFAVTLVMFTQAVLVLLGFIISRKKVEATKIQMQSV